MGHKTKMSFVIRECTKNDLKEILKLIQELADYEKMPNGPKLTEKDLEEHGFGPRPYFECLVVFEPSKPDVLIGFVLFFYIYSTWEGPSVFMEDLYVTPASRGQGLGTKLWQGVVQAGLDKNCKRCQWNCLDWNKPSIEFYKSKGAIDLTETEGWLSFRLTREQMESFVKS